MDFLEILLVALVVLMILVFIVPLVMVFGESLQWWEFNMISDCNDYNYTCSTQ